MTPQDRAAVASAVTLLVNTSHGAAKKAGWWNDPITGGNLSEIEILANTGWKLALIHTEVSEATEGIRKSLNDDHLPQHPMGAVEFADAIIRIADLAGALGYDLGAALADKLEYNEHRLDHKIESRAAAGGKKY